jgi:hypothetical protein
MGEQWSLFFKTYYETVFFELGSKIKTEHTENAVLIELDDAYALKNKQH